ncbi:MAG TPA: NFACT RNA binding domain-containing protein [Candidatus Marinimicrobia bacterium]|nr:NFACT RNA binding domain-containing protein [Candidatus Neomarinimicrobiota bacterium]HRS51875.1 NFACT RNA binding domain-containing protein [Candidatus Neomarinimicrobiota bacterium]HRU92664.1 NFACT RNA binding domain-containing protein [Candidatus Neomarinimicrobiota bacterium]
MFNSWLHIERMAREFKQLIGGAICGAPFTYQKDHLHIPLEMAGDWQCLHFCVQAPLPFLTLERDLPNPKHKVNLLRDVTGKTITDLVCRENDRQILITLNGGIAFLLFRLYGINGNVHLLDSSGESQDSFKKVKKTVDFEWSNFRPANRLFPDDDDIISLLHQHPDQSLMTFFTKSFQPVLPKTLVTEIGYRTNLSPQNSIINLSKEQVEILAKTLAELADEMATSLPRIYIGEPPIFSLIELQSLSNRAFTQYDSVITAQNQFIQDFLNLYRLNEKKKSLLRQTDLQLSTIQRKLINQQNELATLPTADNYREWADTLMAAASSIPHHSNSVTLPQLTDESYQITIPLDPRLNPIQNAERYYAKSREIERSRSELAQKISEGEQLIQRLKDIRKKIAEANDFKILRPLSSHLPTQLQNSIENIHQPFIRINLNGWEILIGKSARDNDELLQKYARPNDFWLHAQGTSGSHIVVRNPGKVVSLPRPILEKAAGLAAFHSKAKHSAVVPVIFTQCKYVTKPRHSAPGAVTVKFEKTIMAEPLDPKKFL